MTENLPELKASTEAYPDEIGVVKYVSGEYDVFPHLANIPPSVKYIREDAIRPAEAQAPQGAEIAEAVKTLTATEFTSSSDITWREKEAAETLVKHIQATRPTVQQDGRVEGLVKALEFYADIKNYRQYYQTKDRKVEKDGGSLATEALRAFKGE